MESNNRDDDPAQMPVSATVARHFPLSTFHFPLAAGVVVAGGESRRLGMDKRRLRLWGADGPSLLAHMIELLRPWCAEVLVVLRDPEAWPDLPARLVRDGYRAGGAMGGVATGLAHVRETHALVVAADLPLLTPALLERMLSEPRGYRLLAPRRAVAIKSGGWEPLCAVYERGCLAELEACLARGALGLGAFCDAVGAQALDPDILATCDPSGQALRNLNTPDDLRVIQRVLAIAGGG